MRINLWHLCKIIALDDSLLKISLTSSLVLHKLGFCANFALSQLHSLHFAEISICIDICLSHLCLVFLLMTNDLIIEPINAFTDNYIWCVYSPSTRRALVVDPGQSEPVKDFLSSHQLQLETILITHHHYDHTDGVSALRQAFPAKVYGPTQSPFQQADYLLGDKDTISVLGLTFDIIQVPGHTLDHIAYYNADEHILFCGDTLFLAGCGRVFEGTMGQMHASLQRLASLPPETLVYPTHEYSLANLTFAQTVEPDNTAIHSLTDKCKQQRMAAEPTLPTSIGQELQVNPFLRCQEAAVIAAANHYRPGSQKDPLEVFARLREWKNNA